MDKSSKTKSQLIEELAKLTRKIKRLEREITKQKLSSTESSASSPENLEKSFLEKEKNYRTLIESSLDAIFVLQDDKFVLVNPAWEQLFGYKLEELNSNNFNFMDIIAPSDKEKIKNRLTARKLNLPLRPRYELKGKTKDGRIIDLEVNVSEIFWNGKKAIQGIYRDITERKKIEEALRREAFIFDNLYDAIILTDLDGKILNWNSAATKLYGYTKEEVLNSPVEFLNENKGNIIISERIIDVVKKEGKWTGEINFIRKDGTKGTSETIVFPFIDAQGEKVALVGVNRDITERKKSEAALLESEDKFRKIAEKSLVGIYLIQKEIFKYVNPRLAEIFGYSVDELVDKKGPGDLTHPEDVNTVNNNITKRIAGEQVSIYYEFRGYTKEKKTIYVEVYGSRTTYLGKPAVVGTLLDITERKQHERALQDSKMKFEDLAELLPQTVFEIDLQGKIIFANKSGFNIFKYTRADFEKGISIFQILIPGEHKRAVENLQRALRREKIEEKEYIALKKDGTTFPALVFTSPIFRDNVPIGWRGLLIDITDRKKTEDELRKLSWAVEQSPNSIMITNIFGDLEYVNPRFTEVTGFKAAEVIGRNPRFLKTGYTSPDNYKNLWELISNGKKWRGEFQNKKKNGEFYWESASISPILDSTGKIKHYLAIKEDITEKKIIEKELIKAKERAEESDKLKSEFLAQMSHEIRSPINVILSYNSFLRDEFEGKLESHYLSSFSSIDSAGKRLLRTIDLILNMAALQSGYIDFQLGQLDLSSNINSLIKEFDYSAKLKNINLSFNNITPSAKVIADEYLVSEIFQNLIGNAIKYTNEGEVEVKIYENHGEKICVDVRDSGIGISEDYLPKLFLPFSQEEMGYSRKYEGNGLGLALVKKYIELIGAEINVKSKKGTGSIFTVIFNRSS